MLVKARFVEFLFCVAHFIDASFKSRRRRITVLKSSPAFFSRLSLVHVSASTTTLSCFLRAVTMFDYAALVIYMPYVGISMLYFSDITKVNEAQIKPLLPYCIQLYSQ